MDECKVDILKPLAGRARGAWISQNVGPELKPSGNKVPAPSECWQEPNVGLGMQE